VRDFSGAEIFCTTAHAGCACETATGWKKTA
jgi:hypothetical protein